MIPSATHTHPTILVTGATGLLGGAVAAELLRSEKWTRVLLLVRGEDSAHALQRVQVSLARFVTDEALLSEIKPANILVGDFTQPSTYIADPRLASIRRIAHAAGLNSLENSRRAFATNVDGTLRFVHHLRTVAEIERFLYVSTAMVCGSQPASVTREEDASRSGIRHALRFSASKAETERLLRLTLVNFPLVIARPSLVVGHSEFGTIPSASAFWPFRAAQALGLSLGQPEGRVDVIPVDYAGRCLFHLLLKPALRSTTYHISSGLESACTWGEIAAAFGESGSDLQPAESLLGRVRPASMRKAIRLYGNFLSLNTVFDTRSLRDEGIPPSPRFVDYLAACCITSEPFSISEQMAHDLS